MLNKEDIEITLPPKEYLEKSSLIRKIGYIGKNLDNKETDYWTSSYSYINNDCSYQFRMSSDGQFCHTKAGETYSVRPIIQAANLEDIVKSSPFKTYKKGFIMIELGKWYTPNSVKIANLEPSFLFKNKCFKANQKEIGFEINTINGVFAITNTEIHKVVPINWYYDEENNLLLSEHTLFNSTLSDEKNPFLGDFKTTSLYKSLNNEFLSCLLENINQENSYPTNDLIAKINELLEENEKLKENIKRLNEIQEISNQKIKILK